MKQNIKRVLIKLSGEALVGNQKFAPIHQGALSHIVEDIIEVYECGVEIGIVVGGGNFLRGASQLATEMSRVEADKIGMLTTVQNSIILADKFNRMGIPNQAFSAVEMNSILPVFNSDIANRALSEKKITIFGGGTGNPFFTTDTAAVLRACEINADLMLKATKVDGVYSSDPKKDKQAIFYPKISYHQILQDKLKVMDLTAVSLAMDNNLLIKVFNVRIKRNIKKAIYSDKVGTLISRATNTVQPEE